MNNPIQFMQMMRNPQMQQQLMNNPQFQQQYQQRMRSMNPGQVISQIKNYPEAMDVPIAKNTIEMLENNDTEGLVELAKNTFKEKGHDYSEFEKQAKQFLGFC